MSEGIGECLLLNMSFPPVSILVGPPALEVDQLRVTTPSVHLNSCPHFGALSYLAVCQAKHVDPSDVLLCITR